MEFSIGFTSATDYSRLRLTIVGDLQLNNAPNSPLNLPFWGTSEPFKVPQNGGFRGR
jgi:hypothetical protein